MISDGKCSFPVVYELLSEAHNVFWCWATEIAHHSWCAVTLTQSPFFYNFFYQQSTFKPLIAELINEMLSKLKTRCHLHWYSNGILRSSIRGWVVSVYTTHQLTPSFHHQYRIVYDDSRWWCSAYIYGELTFPFTHTENVGWITRSIITWKFRW
jgi:hypothetical protein